MQQMTLVSKRLAQVNIPVKMRLFCVWSRILGWLQGFVTWVAEGGWAEIPCSMRVDSVTMRTGPVATRDYSRSNRILSA
jgi:hypothetical protein